MNKRFKKKPLVIPGTHQVEELKHQKGYSGKLQDEIVGKPRTDHPDSTDAVAVNYLPQQHLKRAAEYLKLEKKPLTTKGIPKDELQEGKEHEHEHTANSRAAKQIALDHLQEDKHYYTHLEHMEQKQAFDRGFIKAAIDRGIAPLVAIQLLKQANANKSYKRPKS